MTVKRVESDREQGGETTPTFREYEPKATCQPQIAHQKNDLPVPTPPWRHTTSPGWHTSARSWASTVVARRVGDSSCQPGPWCADSDDEDARTAGLEDGAHTGPGSWRKQRSGRLTAATCRMEPALYGQPCGQRDGMVARERNGEGCVT